MKAPQIDGERLLMAYSEPRLSGIQKRHYAHVARPYAFYASCIPISYHR